MAELELKPHADRPFTAEDLVCAGETFAPLRVTVGLRQGSLALFGDGEVLLALFGDGEVLREIAEQLHQKASEQSGTPVPI